LHHKAQKDALMIHECEISAPAGFKNVLNPTFSERK